MHSQGNVKKYTAQYTPCNCDILTQVLSYDGVTSLCICSSESKERKVIVYVNGGT